MPSPSAPLETEWLLMRAACSEAPPQETICQIRALLDRQIRWPALITLAEYHGVQPLIAQALLRLEDELPREIVTTLKQNYQANLHKMLRLSREFVRIVDCLSEAGIEFIPYKGLALAEAIYGDIALRQSGDIDLLIHPADLKRVREVLAPLGFTAHFTLSDPEENAYLKSGYECVFDAPAGRNLLEVQWAIQPRFYAVDLDIEGLFRRAQPAAVTGVRVNSLALEDLFVILAVHAAKHVWGRLIWICDLARIGALPTLNWKAISNHAQELGVVRILRVTLLLAQKLLGSDFAAGTAQNLPEDLASGPLAEEIESYITGDKSYDVESAAYFRLMLRLRERRVDHLRFATRFFFTPGPGEWSAMRLPKPLVPLYRIMRITRLAARIIRGRV